MDQKGQSGLAAVALGALVFLIVLTVYGQVNTVHDGIIEANAVNHIDTITTNANSPIFSSGTRNLIDLLPLVLVGSLLVAVAATVALRG